MVSKVMVTKATEDMEEAMETEPQTIIQPEEVITITIEVAAVALVSNNMITKEVTERLNLKSIKG